MATTTIGWKESRETFEADVPQLESFDGTEKVSKIRVATTETANYCSQRVEKTQEVSFFIFLKTFN